MNTFIIQAQEAAKECGHARRCLRTGAIQDHAGALQRHDRKAGCEHLHDQQADEFLLGAVKLADAQRVLLLDIALQGSSANDALAPVIAGYKSASKAVVTTFEQILQSKKALYAVRAA
jgi:hypothetical protein